METIVGIGGATSITMLLVALFKKAAPSAPSKLITAVAVLAGQVSSILVTMASTGLQADQRAISTMIIIGITASAAAAGINRTDQSAESDRVAIGAKDPPEESGI